MSRFLRFFLPSFLVIGLISCGKEKSIDSLDGGDGILRMDIDGKLWTASGKNIVASVMNGYVSIVGESRNIILNMQLEAETEGTFQLDQVSSHIAFLIDNNEPVAAAYGTDQGANTSEAGGVVTITKIDMATKRMSGTFSFKLYRASDNKTLMITNGSFDNISFTAGTAPVGNSQMSAKIDGADWTAQSVMANAGSGILTIMGGDPAKGITIVVNSDITPNTYNLGNPGSLISAFYMQSTNPFIAESGQLKIDEHNTTAKTMKGSFNFTGKETGTTNTKAITSGTFSISY